MLKNCRPGRGNILLEMNIRIKNRKQPMDIRSKMLRRKAATIRLIAIIESIHRIQITSAAFNELRVW